MRRRSRVRPGGADRGRAATDRSRSRPIGGKDARRVRDGLIGLPWMIASHMTQTDQAVDRHLPGAKIGNGRLAEYAERPIEMDRVEAEIFGEALLR